MTKEKNSLYEREERINKLKKLESLEINPYPAKAKRDYEIADFLNNFDNLSALQKNLYLVGRIKSIRSHGNLSFAHIEDVSGKIQLAFSKKELGDENYKKFIKLIDVADFIEVNGQAFLTHKGEKSLMIKDWKILSKAIRPLPDSWYGLKDEEERYRRRYLDIIANSEVREMIEKRAKFWQATRTFLLNKGFLEVETPVLETSPGGADAQPFTTHHNALDIPVYLRISTGELWQKKLMIAGFEKTFEIGRQFRNEGMDADHLQDYTQMEFYLAYANYEDGMNLVTEMFRYIAQETFGKTQFTIKNFKIDLNDEWKRYDYRQTVLDYTGIDVLKTNEKEIKKKLDELKVVYDEKGFNLTRAIDNLWKYCRKQIPGPGFLINTPITVSPLAKRDEKNPALAQRFQPIIAGSELGNGYSELNNPLDQEERFKEQQKLREAGDQEAQRHDQDFIEALEYGMPPTCGFGFSERLFSYLMNKSSRECQIFPLMRPKN
jgi:lysyl-tRNA synthetase, class II